MTNERGQHQTPSKHFWSGLTAVLTVVAFGAGSFSATAASAQADKKGSKPTKIVKEVTRGTYGEILTTLTKMTLYIQPGGTCTAGCLTVWPPLLMPAGKTVPAGATGLGTETTTSGLQVTYNGLPLYTFSTDTKKSTNGENVGGFVVAQVGSTATVAEAKTKAPKAIVAETSRPPFGEILTTVKSKTLYTEPSGTCTAACLEVWPPLLMPKGQTMPTGAGGLGIQAYAKGREQVTYNSLPLYTFTGDKKTSANGNDVGGFVVAQVAS